MSRRDYFPWLPPTAPRFCALLICLGCNATRNEGDQGHQDGGTAPPDLISADAEALYTVSGNVEGLKGVLQLRLNAGASSEQALRLQNNGAFSFDFGLPDGAPYDLSVAEQPKAQYCSVEPSHGTIQHEPVTDLRVRCQASEAGLAGFVLSAGTLSPAFSADVTRYRIDTPAWVSVLDVEPMLSDNDSVVYIEGMEYRGKPLSFDLASDKQTLTVESHAENGEIVELTLDIYPAATITELAYGKPLAPSEGAQFGATLAVSGDWLAVGAPGMNSSARGFGGDEEDRSASQAGAAYLFKRDGSSYRQVEFVKPHNADEDDYFGYALAMAGDLLVVGAFGEDGGSPGVNGRDDNTLPTSGAAYVFRLTDGKWEQEAYLKPNVPGSGAEFGRALATDGKRIVVGEWHDKNSARGVDPPTHDEDAIYSGAAYVFEQRGGDWTQVAYLKASNADIGDSFGYSVAVSGDWVVVGAPEEQSLSGGAAPDSRNNQGFAPGAAYAFSYDADNDRWFEAAYLKAASPDEFDRFGYSVAVSETRIAVGAQAEASDTAGINPKVNNKAEKSGAVYVFEPASGSPSDSKPADKFSWKQTHFIKAANSDSGDQFGAELRLLGDTLVVGAPQESGGQRGLTASPANNDAIGAGAVYVFFDAGSGFEQKRYVKASNTDAGDSFGAALGFDGTTLLIGAPYEDSGLGGVAERGSPNNTQTSAGAFYVFQ